MVFQLDHGAPDDWMVAIVRLLIIIELAQFCANLRHSIVVVVLHIVIVLIVVAACAEVSFIVVVVQLSNLFAHQEATDLGLDLDKLVHLTHCEALLELGCVPSLD